MHTHDTLQGGRLPSILDVVFENITDEGDGTSFQVINYNVASMPVSFHIPAQRFLMSLWAEYVRRTAGQIDANADLVTLLTSPDSGSTDPAARSCPDRMQTALLLLECPLRILVLFAQNQAGMWIRNGLAIPGQQYAYSGSTLSESMFEIDILAVQAACCELGADDFVRVLLHRFGVAKWFSLMEVTQPEVLTVLMEELLVVFIMVVCERQQVSVKG
jgi:hypothetical protein